MRSYSQYSQDTHVSDFYGRRQEGYFVEIGAFDGIYLSNTYMLERELRWKGICFEPLPDKFALLEKRRDAICVNAAIATCSGEKVTFARPEKGQSFLAGIVTHLDGWGKETALGGPQFELETLNLTEALDEHNAPAFIHYLTLDTEGSELAILQGIDFSRYTFGYICVEHNDIEPRRSQIRKLLEQHGYFFHKKNQCDDDYFHPSALSGIYFYHQDQQHPIYLQINADLSVVASSSYWPDQTGVLHPEQLTISFESMGKAKIGATSVIFSESNRWEKAAEDLMTPTAQPRHFLTQNALRNATGILHLGAHLGQEATEYQKIDRPVVWVEAQPAIFLELQENLKPFSNQVAVCALIGDSDDKSATLNISNNRKGISSSIFPFGSRGSGDGSLWPELNLQMTKKLQLPMMRLDTLLNVYDLDAEHFDFWVLDLQGAEILALKGAPDALKSCNAIYSEFSTVNVYDGGAQLEELTFLLDQHGFKPAWTTNAEHDDMLFTRSRSLFK